MPNTMIQVAILGAGRNGRAHSEAYGRRDDCRVVAVADADEARGRPGAAASGAEWYPDWRAMLARSDVAAVSVCLPHALHEEAVVAAAEAGKHVLCEKPIAIRLGGADRMIRACAAAGVTLMVGHTHRFLPQHVKAKALLDAGAIGRIVQVRDVTFAGRDVLEPQGWRGDTALSGGGAFMDNGVHAADRLRWWLNDEVAWVAARTGRATDLIQAEDHGVALLAFRAGATATIEQALTVPQAAGTCYAEFLGTEGVLRVDTWERRRLCFSLCVRKGLPALRVDRGQRLRLATRGRPWEEIPTPADASDGFDAEIAEFVAAVREGRRPAVTGEDGRAALEIVEAVYASASRDAPVALPLSAGGSALAGAPDRA